MTAAMSTIIVMSDNATKTPFIFPNFSQDDWESLEMKLLAIQSPAHCEQSGLEPRQAFHGHFGA